MAVRYLSVFVDVCDETLTGVVRRTGPHIGLSNAWPMSLLIQAQTSDDEDEIKECLNLVLKSAQLGLIHESINVNARASYTSE